MTPLTHQTTPAELTMEPSGAPTPEMQRIPDSTKLAHADKVSIRRHDGSLSSGRIDMLSMERRVFWIIQNDGKGRTMIETDKRPPFSVAHPTAATKGGRRLAGHEESSVQLGTMHQQYLVRHDPSFPMRQYLAPGDDFQTVRAQLPRG